MVVVLENPSNENHNHHHATREAFDRSVAPLERASGRRLGNPQRRECFEAFQRYPKGVAAQARDALADSDGSNPLGLFIYRVRHGWHELDPLDEEYASEPPASALAPSGIPGSDDEVVVSAVTRACRLLERNQHLRPWLASVGLLCAESERDFRAEVARTWGISDAELVEELRRIARSEAR